MAQISLYINESMLGKLNDAAKNNHCSVSKYVAALISDKLSQDDSEEIRKKQLLKQLRGALDDPSFAVLGEISWEHEIPRRFDII